MALGRWKWFFAKWRLVHSKRRKSSGIQQRVSLNAGDPTLFPPNIEPYARLAEYWNDVGASYVPHYGEILEPVSRRFDVPIRSVLDVACGGGLVSAELGAHVDRLVGIDASDAMLQRARWENPQPKFRFLQADFRNVRLDETFDAAVCASDSLNYVDTQEDLNEVFRSMHAALNPGGLFLFDVLTERAFKSMANVTVSFKVNGSEFQENFYYDPATRRGECRVKFADGSVECHRRIPLEAADIEQAAAASGLHVAERFSAPRMLGLARLTVREFWILRKP